MDEMQLEHLMEAAESDAIYQELLELRRIYEPQFQRILLSLPETDQISLKMYVRVCEGIEGRLSRIAYFLTPIP